jgi:hypothetical protein
MGGSRIPHRNLTLGTPFRRPQFPVLMDQNQVVPEPGKGNATARLHQSDWGHDGCMASDGTRAAADAGDWQSTIKNHNNGLT